MVTRQRILTKAILVMAFKKEKWHKREEGESKLVKTQFFLFGFTAWCFYAFPVTDKLLFCFELHLKCLICQAFKNDHKADNFLLLLESFFTEMKWQTCGESNCGVIYFSWIHTFCALPWTSTAWWFCHRRRWRGGPGWKGRRRRSWHTGRAARWPPCIPSACQWGEFLQFLWWS